MTLATGVVFIDKPYKGSITPTLTTDRSRRRTNGTWNTVTATRLASGLWVASLTGAATSYIDVGNNGGRVQAAAIWLFPDDITTRSFMDLDGGTHSLETDGSGDVTATGWAAPTFNVDGVAAATRLTLSAWNLVLVTTATPFLASDLDIGREAAAYWDGMVGLTTLFTWEPSAGEALALFNKQRPHFGR